MNKHLNKHDDKVSAWIDDNSTGGNGRISAHLMICNNGYQSSGAAIYSVEAAKAALSALQAFVDELGGKND